MYATLAIQLQQKLGYRKASKWNRRVARDDYFFLKSQFLKAHHITHTTTEEWIIHNPSFWFQFFNKGSK